MSTLKENEMKNNAFRRLLAMAAAGAMLTSIAACDSSSGDDTASNGSDSTSLISRAGQ